MFLVSVTNGSQCVANCESVGLYYDSTNNKCVGCHDACDSCFGPDSDDCYSCADGFVKVDSTTCDTECNPSNSYLTDNGTVCNGNLYQIIIDNSYSLQLVLQFMFWSEYY